MPLDTPNIVRGFLLCLLFTSFLVRNRGNNMRHAFYWILIFVVIGVGYSCKELVGNTKDRFLSHLLPGYAVVVNNEIRVQKADDGHFYLFVALNGKSVKFLIDTGATSVVLSRSYATTLGLDPNTLKFNTMMRTANGMTRNAPVFLETFEVAGFVLHDFPAYISEVEMDGCMLGMSFLKRLKSYEMNGDTLKLRY